MCKHCDAQMALMSPEEKEEFLRRRDELQALQGKALADLVRFINTFAADNGEMAPPAIVRALALALGGTLARVPIEVREAVIGDALGAMSAAANANDDGGQMKVTVVNAGEFMRTAREAIDPRMVVRPPTVH